ncbi:peptide/nickel transport system permease protein [Paenibacillus sp. UNCCL117]|uniref:ABC transporter permease n=1 Tax=unclassified Paenibacillus TaxID=185978 RepID=UPI000887FB22|nr:MULTISPECIES: ABC transporter permease [unclassified Paenibacillus]SDD06155.1 peptide/nickel transport system permease protein [Paenibacillus sp. cl123]SFW31748.1 peptide/nickel transport system permease protein [Paenibacillus sp. UNCCL117]
MVRFLGGKLYMMLLQVIVVATLVFSLVHLMPGDPAALVLGTERGGDAAALAEMRHMLGLDRPLLQQYLDWVGNFVRLDMGKSLFDQTPVTEYIAQRLPNTIELALVSIILAALIGVPLGIIAALKRQSAVDLILSSISALGVSFPVYVLGAFLILLFSFKLQLFPASGFVAFSEDPVRHIQRMALPAITLALGLAASIARMTRSSMLETLNKDYIQTHKAKGLPYGSIIFKHALRNAIIPVVTIIGLQLGNLIGGTVLIEYLFNWPGMSTLLVKSISNRDYPLIQGCIVVMATFFILVNMLVDVLYGLMDPRVR